MAFSNFITENIEAIERLNQRGGRMLSIIDLINRNTLDTEMACFLINEVQKGSSILVVAEPGAAGKTTLMGALLGVIPYDRQIITYSERVYNNQNPGKFSKLCIIAHEIGKGNWYGYIWGKEVKKYFQLQNPGKSGQNNIALKNQLITNMHQDEPDLILQTLNAFGITTSHFLETFDLVIKLKYRRNLLSFGSQDGERYIEKIWKISNPIWRVVFQSKFKDESERKVNKNINSDSIVKFLFNKDYFSPHELQDYRCKSQEIVKKIKFCLDNNITHIAEVMEIFNKNSQK